MAVLSFIVANHVYELSGRWFSRATYVAECARVTAPNQPVQCARLAAEPGPPSADGVEVTDKDILLAEGSTMNNVGTALITITGVLLAAAALSVALAELGRRSARQSSEGVGPLP